MPREQIPISKATNAYDLLDEVIQVVLGEPTRLDMQIWIRDVTRKGKKYAPSKYDRLPACGTVGCIAGWIHFLRKGRQFMGFDQYYIVEQLGFEGGANHASSEYWTVYDELFSADGIYTDVGIDEDLPEIGTKAYAELVASRIRTFQHRHETRLRAHVLTPPKVSKLRR